MALRPTEIHSSISGRDVRPLVMSAADVADYLELRHLGIDLDERSVRHMISGMGLDAAPDLQPTVYPGTAATPIQFLQNWLPGFVSAITQVRTADELIGITTAGDWEDEEVIQGVLEPTGVAQVYGDYTNVPLASWNLGFERRSIVRFEEGMQVGILEEARASKVRVASAARKRAAAGLALDIQRNRVAFYGYNAGAGRTYGFLNDPSLPAYVNVPNGAGGSPLWANKTFLEITADIRSAFGALIVQAGGLIKNNDAVTLALPLGVDNFLSVTSEFGNSVRQWLKETYPNMRVVTAPELVAANGGVGVFYMYADKVMDGDSDDGGQTWLQIVPTKFKTLGVEKRAKNYLEDYTNATAGVMLKRPFAVVRRSGIS
jgi:hypothetical protein